MAIKDYSSIVSNAKKNKKKDEKNTSSNFKDYSSIVEKRVLYKTIGFDTFESDINNLNKRINSATSGWQTQETMKNTLSSVQRMNDRLDKYQEYRTKYGNDELPDISELQTNYKSSMDYLKSLSEEYSGYDDAESYKKVADERKKLQTADLEKLKKDVAHLEATLETAAGYEDYLSRPNESYSDAVNMQNMYKDFLKKGGYESYKDIEKALSESKRFLNNATRTQEKIKLGSVGDVNSENYDKDYEKYVEIGKGINPEDIGTSTTSVRVRNRKGKKTTVKSKDKQAAEALSAFLKGEKVEDDYYSKDAIFALMTEKEFNDVAYYLAKDQEDGGSRTVEYVEALEETLNARRGEEIAESVDGTWRQGAFALTAGLDQFVTGWTNNTSKKDYIPVNQIQYASGEIREDIYEDKGWLGRTGYDLLNTTSNMLPSILMSTASNFIAPGSGAAVGAVTMGTSARGNAYQEMLNLGYDKSQANTYANLVGISEAGLQYAIGGISKLGGIGGKLSKAVQGIDNGLARFAIQYGGSMLSEGFEEAAQEVLNPLFMNIAAGYDTGAEIDWGEVVYSGLLGALSGGLMEGPSLAINSVAEHYQNKNIGQNIRDNNQITDVFDLASNPEIASAYDTYTRYAQKGINAENATDAQVGRMWQEARNDTEGKKIVTPNAYEKLGEMAKPNLQRKLTEALNKQSKVNKKNESADSLIETALDKPEDTEAHKLATELKEKADKGEKITKDERTKLAQAIKEDTVKSVSERLTELGEVENASEIADIVTRNLSNEEITKEEFEKVLDSKHGLQVLNENKNEVASFVKGMDANESALFMKTYDGNTDMEAFANSFNLVSEYAKHSESFTVEDAVKNKGVLSEDTAKFIYEYVLENEGLKSAQSNAELMKRVRSGERGIIDESAINYGKEYVSGKVHWSSLTERQQHAVIFAKGLYKALGSNLAFVGKNKKFNGMYNATKDITFIDVYAGRDYTTWTGTDTIISTISHELTHEMKYKAPEAYKSLTDLTFKALEKSTGLTRSDLIATEVEKLKNRGESHTDEDAVDEIVARACEDMLANSKEAKAILKELSPAEQKTFVEKIQDIIQKIVDWIDEFLSSYKHQANSEEAKALRKMKEDFETMSAMWDKGLREMQSFNKNTEATTETTVTENSSVVEETSNGDISETVDSSTPSFVTPDMLNAVDENGKTMFQYRAMEEDEEIYRGMLNKHKDIIGITDAQIDDLFNTIDKALDIIKDNLEALDYAWDADVDDRAFNPVKPNSDSLYQVSLDFSTLCRKRLLQQTIQQTLQNALNKNLSTEESIAIRDELMKLQEEGRKIEVACALCYVESARMKSPKQINKFLNTREAVIKDFFARRNGGSIKDKVKNAELKARKELQKANPDGLVGKNGVVLDPLTATKGSMLKADANYIREAGKKARESYKLTEHEQAELNAAKTMSIDNFTSAKGLENLAKSHPDIFDAYTSFVRNATRSKAIENDTWWRAGDSESIGDNLIAQMNAENGLRSQSWSDFQVIHLLDYIAATIELSTKGTKRQSYTKVPDYVKLLGNTGDMINMSLIPERVFNGKLSYDGVEGMAYDIAKQLRDEYHGTVGTICIGINNEQIRMLLEDATIDMVIPYHHSSMSKAVRKLMHIPAWETYQNYQNEKNLSDADAKARAKELGVKLKKDEMYQKAPKFSEWFNLEEARQIAKFENDNPSDMKAYKKYGKMYGGYMAMQNAANKYIKLCAERGLAPKFSNENSDFTKDANYWKLLIDRKMVDNVTGEIIEQKAIKPIFNEKSVLEILNDELARYPQVKADQEYATRKVTEKFLSGDMKMDKSTRDAIRKPIDNITEVNILESVKEDKMMMQARELQQKDPTTLTEHDFKNLLGFAKEKMFADGSYIPARIGTPQILIAFAKEHGIILENHPLAMRVYKARQALSNEAEWDGNPKDKPHDLSVDEVVEIVKALNNPSYLVYQTQNDRFAEIVKFSKNGEKSKAYAIIDFFDVDKNPEVMNGYKGGKYNILVTIYPSENSLELQNYLKNKNNIVMTGEEIKKKGISQRGLGSYVPAHLNDVPFYEDSISNSDPNVNTEISNDKVKHQSREENIYDIMGERNAWVERNTRLEADFDRLKERWSIDKSAPSKDQIGMVARYLVGKSESKMKSAELEKRLTEAYTYIADALGTDAKLTWEDVSDVFYNIASDLVKDTEASQGNYSKAILDDIRKTRVSLSEEQKEALRGKFGSDWITRFMGKVVVANDGVSLDSQWQKWANKYPTLFSKDTNAQDMAIELYSVISNLNDAGNLISEYENAEKTSSLAEEIYNKFWTITPINAKSEQDVNKIKKLNLEHRKTMAETKSISESVSKADRNRVINLANELRDRRERAVARAKDLGKKRLDSFKENANRKTVLQSTMATAMSLNKKLSTNSKDVHIPESLKPVVQELLNAIDFSSKQLLEMKGTRKEKKGLPTNADIARENALSKVHSMATEKSDVVSLRKAIKSALELFENAEKVLQSSSDGIIDSSIVALDTDMIKDINDMIESLDLLIEKGEKDFVLQKMSTKNLVTLNKMVKSINHWAIVADKALANKHKKRISDLGMQTVEETNEYGVRQEYIKGIEDLKNFFNWSNLLPVNAFKRLGNAAMEFFDGLRDAQDKVTFNRQEVMDFTDELLKKYKQFKPKNWRTEVKTFDVKLPGENKTTKVEMPVSYIMTLYCVAKQEDAQRHLFGMDASGNKLTYKDEKGNVHDGGGMTIKGYKEGKHSLKVNKNLDNTIVNENIVKQITSVLTKEQIEVADALQEYMNTKGSEWGDAVSMALYGIKKFGTENYFPITVSPHTLNADKIRDAKASMFSILNYGLTKERNPNAKQSIEIGDIFDVFANHMNMVAIYNAYALPVFDIARWYNFKGKTENGKEIAVTTSIEKSFGSGATTYINNLIKDLNGQHESSRLGFISKIFKNTKVAMVGNSISVALLQPTAYLKAMVKVSPKYLLKSALYVRDFGAKKGVEKAKKYCGIALLKSQGYFETGVSSNTTTKMMHDESVGEKVTEWSLKGAEWMDERTWGVLWNACEFEVRAERKDLKVGSEEFYNVVAEKLRDIIYETQVVDSPLTKSDLMRSGDTGAKMVTMFASEMTVAYNMVFESAYQTHLDSKKYGKAKALKKNAKNLSMTLMAYTMTSVANAALSAFVDSFRHGDDEEDENKFLKNFLADWLIVGKIPYFKEAMSMAQGFSSSRTDTLWLQSAFKAYEYWSKASEAKDGASMKAFDETLKSISYVTGAAAYNQWRDLRALLRSIGIME